jgi:hypothetical protein
VIGKTLCVSCFNRQNEVIRGANGKRQFPAIVATRLHKTFAILTGNALMQTFYFAPIIRRDALPRLTQISPGAYWLETIVASENELRAFVDRRIPSAEIDNFELMPDFSRSRDNTMEASGNP